MPRTLDDRAQLQIPAIHCAQNFSEFQGGQTKWAAAKLSTHRIKAYAEIILFFANLKRQTSTLILPVCIKYSMRYHICDVNYGQLRSCDMDQISVNDVSVPCIYEFQSQTVLYRWKFA